MEDHFKTEIIEKEKEIDGEVVIQKWKRVSREVQVRKQVLERNEWQKWGLVEGIRRGEHKEGDMMVEQEIKLQALDGNQLDERNFVIPPAKQTFFVDLGQEEKKEEEKQRREGVEEQIRQGRKAGESIRFDGGKYNSSSTQQWLLMVSNLLQFEEADTYSDI